MKPSSALISPRKMVPAGYQVDALLLHCIYNSPEKKSVWYHEELFLLPPPIFSHTSRRLFMLLGFTFVIVIISLFFSHTKHSGYILLFLFYASKIYSFQLFFVAAAHEGMTIFKEGSKKALLPLCRACSWRRGHRVWWRRRQACIRDTLVTMPASETLPGSTSLKTTS